MCEAGGLAWIGGGEAVTRDLPLAAVGFLEQEQLLVAFGDVVTRGVNRSGADGIGTCKRPVIGHHFDLDDVERDVEIDRLEDGLVGGFDRVAADGRGVVLCHEQIQAHLQPRLGGCER